MKRATEFQYRVPWRAASGYPGSHLGIQRGSGYEVHGVAPLYAASDPRRFDLRASMRDPFERLLVRVFKQRSVVPVHVLADVSASMSFVGLTCKFDLLIDFVASLAYSTHRVGDPFSFTACDTVIRHEHSLPLTRTRGASALLIERLRHWTPTGADASGLLAGAEQLPGTRALVFLVSDFHLPDTLLRSVLACLCGHCIVPVVLIDSAETRVSGTGIARMYDAETGIRRTVLRRPIFARRLQKQQVKRNEQLRQSFADHNLRPLYVIDEFESEAVSRYFYG